MNPCAINLSHFKLRWFYSCVHEELSETSRGIFCVHSHCLLSACTPLEYGSKIQLIFQKSGVECAFLNPTENSHESINY